MEPAAILNQQTANGNMEHEISYGIRLGPLKLGLPVDDFLNLLFFPLLLGWRCIPRVVVLLHGLNKVHAPTWNHCLWQQTACC